MFGSPPDIEDQCNEHLYIADDYGDGQATMRCQLPKGHEGSHREIFHRDTSGEVTVTWQRSERCWHEFVNLDSIQAFEFYLKEYKDEAKARAELRMDAACFKRMCIKCENFDD